MGQKVNPVGFRVAVTKDWLSKWYADKKDYAPLLLEDIKIRELVKTKLATAAVPKSRSLLPVKVKSPLIVSR